MHRNVRLLLLNPYGCRLNDTDKMNQLQKVIKNYDIDIVMLNEANAKWDTVNISKIEKWMKKINREA